MIKLSIIIPVYNTEKYLSRCITSCIKQNVQRTEYEIIIINDGSTDDSLSIAEKFAKDYSNIKIFSQKNEGLSSARNKGYSLSQGDYVWFIDSDDWIKENCLSEILYKLYVSDLEALIVAAVNVQEDGTEMKYRSYYPQYAGRILEGIELLKLRNLQPCVPFTIYSRNFLLKHNLFFIFNLFHEDSEFTPRAYYYLKRVQVYNNISYYVFQTPNSITRSVNFKKSFDCIRVADNLFLFSQDIDRKDKIIYYNIIGLMINNGLSGVRFMPMSVKYEFNQFILEYKHLLSCIIKSSILKYKIEGCFFKMFPNKIIRTYKILQLFNK